MNERPQKEKNDDDGVDDNNERENRASYTNMNMNNNKNYLMVIPDGHIWLEGDNSWNSSDSRHYGTVPATLIVGRVLCRVWPLVRSNNYYNHDNDSNNSRMFMERGQPPKTAASAERTIILPAGYEGEEIIKTWEEWKRVQIKMKKNTKKRRKEQEEEK
eukprot:CAMPEP_0202443510 /NCGR_PEP_ID=MMETSP1360-20130828/2740_1 /ASSEMBLY_ACC=CAM_ASM_000848 /TAXON_ID=515479 /ORGANISM="Licmophora paradoxa, Strain CCMP2313" /LENGTH=158 /DNA_ID=CAMNT_0049059203 /DNA_START=73 /DNA_END=549 /DNA_ORIENTATION=-